MTLHTLCSSILLRSSIYFNLKCGEASAHLQRGTELPEVIHEKAFIFVKFTPKMFSSTDESLNDKTRLLVL